MRFYLFTILLFISLNGFSNPNYKVQIDSLQKELTHASSKIKAVRILNQLSKHYRDDGQLDNALLYGLKAEKLALEIHHRQSLIDSYENISEAHRFMGQSKQAIRYLKKELALCIESNDWLGQGNVYDHIAHIHYGNQDTTNALKNHFKALEIRKKYNDMYGQGNSQDNIAHIYVDKNELKKALFHFKKALQTFRKTDDLSRIALASGNVGLLYYWLGNRKAAILHFLQAAEDYDKIKSDKGIVWAYNFISSIYGDAKDFEKAFEYVDKSMKINKKIHDEYGIADAYRHMVDLSFQKKDYAAALIFLSETSKRYTQLKNDSGLRATHYQYGEVYQAKKQYNKAIDEHKKAIQISKKMGNELNEANSYLKIAEIYSLMGNFEAAKAFYLQAKNYYESIQQSESLAEVYQGLSRIDSIMGNHSSEIANFRKFIHYDTIKRSQENDFNKEMFRLQNENKLLKYKQKEKELSLIAFQNKTQRNLAIVGIFILLLVLFFIYFVLRTRIKTNKADKLLLEAQQNENALIKETDHFKSQFLINISHELRTPLTLINGHLEILKNEIQLVENEHIDEIQRNGERLLKLINDILYLSKAESGKYQLMYRRGDFLSEVKAIFQTFHSYAETHAISYQFHTTEEAESMMNFLYSDEALNIILVNLLSNAFKHTPDNGRIVVNVSAQKDFFIVSVKDSGKGIPDKNIEKIFDRFYQVDGSNTRAYDSTGIGLALAKELTNLHGGIISVKNNEENGCLFTFTLKCGEETHLSHTENTFKYQVNDLQSFSESSQVEKNDSMLPTILIVEDQTDLRKFIASNLPSYQCIVATNGRNGYQIAVEKIPDLIVSDIMMPEMDGFALAKQLKENEITSHIPILLLSARSDNEDVIRGLTIGINDYIQKPFSITELNLKIKNQISLIRQQQVRFQTENKPVDVPQQAVPGFSQRDQAFVDKIRSSIIISISDPQLSVELLADKIALSTSQLTRKLKAITGMTPAALIKQEKMKRAAELLNSGKNVSEVTWALGYDSPAYFGKIFKNHFGFPASEAIRQKG